MGCRIIKSPVTGKEVNSITWEQIRDRVSSDEEADSLYEEFLTPKFIEYFGNWINPPTSRNIDGPLQRHPEMVNYIADIIQEGNSEFINEYVGFRKYHDITGSIDDIVNKEDESTLRTLKKLLDKFAKPQRVSKNINEIGEPTIEVLDDWMGGFTAETGIFSGETGEFLKTDEERLTTKATPQQLKKFKEWAKRAGLVGKYLDEMVINGKRYNASGIAKIAQNLYYIVKGKEEISEPEEITHFAVNAISQSAPGLFNQMLSKIGSDPIYDPTFKIYKNDEGYRTEDGKPDVRKIKEEAITKRLVNVLIEKETQGFWADMWDKIRLWFAGLMKKADFDPFEEAAIRIRGGETFGAENSESLKQVAFRVMKTNPGGSIGQQFRDLYNQSKYREALVVINDSLEKDRNGTIEEVLGSESLANLVEFTLGETFAQINQSSSQDKLYNDIKTNKGIPITKEINPDEKEEDGTPKQMYKVASKWIKKRVTDIVKAVYNRIRQDGDINKTQYQRAVDDIKKNYGTEGHADIEHAFSVLVDDNGLVRTSPLDDSQYKPSTTLPIYKILRDNLQERLLTFPAGTKFLSETKIYDPKRDIAGTIDFLAIEPDGKTSILDWKFMDLNTDLYNDVPWYKKKAARIQISEYKRILNEVYGVPLPDFKLTEAIPIKATYVYETGADKKKYPVLTGVTIGNVNTKLEDADYLLPVPLESQSTGDKTLDKLLRKLVGLRTTIESTPSKNIKEKFNKAEQLNILEKAIRHLQIKQSIEPLIEQADIFTKEVQNVIDTYDKTLKDKDFTTIEKRELSDYGIRINRVFDEIDIYIKLKTEVKSLFEGTLTPEEQELWNKIGEATSKASDLREELIATNNEFGNKIALAKQQKGLLDPEVVVSWIKKTFNETSKLATTALKTFYEYRREAQNEMITQSAQENDELVELEKEYEKLAKSKGWKDNNYFPLIMRVGKNSRGQEQHKLIDQYQKEFYTETMRVVKEKDYAWIKENVDTAAYKEALKKDLDEKIELVNARSWTDERKNEVITKLKILYTTTKKDSIGWFAHRSILRKFPLQKWESSDWLELHKPENKAAKGLYDWIIKANEKAKDVGYLADHQSARTFLPFVPKSFAEALVLGSEKGAGKIASENFIRSITIDEDTVGYGAVDQLTGQLINRLPKYFTGNSENRELSQNLFKNLSLYNQSVNKYKYISEIEGIALSLGRVERNKGSILTSPYGVPVSNKEKNEFEIIESNDKNADLYDKQIATLIYGQKYVKSETFDQMLGKVNDFTTAINKALGRKLLPEDIGEKQLSMNKSIDVLTSWFQMKTLGLSPLPALSNFIGGNLQLQINAGKYFTKMDVIKSEIELFSNKLTGEDGKKIIAALKYFIPFNRNTNSDVARQLSVTPLTENGIQEFLMSLMRMGDWTIESTVFLSLFKNAILIDGKIHNAREYVKQSNEYRARYTDGKLQEKEAEFEGKVKALLDEYSLMKLSKIQGNHLVIPGMDQNSPEVYKVRNDSKALSKRAVGNMSDEEVRGANQNIMFNSAMVFKNWIPALADQRLGDLKYNSDIQAWEWGRARTVFRFISLNGVTALKNMYNAARGTEGGIEALNKVYESKKQSYYMATGKELEMTAEEFYDMTRSNLRSAAKDALMTLSLISLWMLAKSLPPDDDEDELVKSRHKFMVRALDKIKDEVSFYYNPQSLQQVINGQIFPSLSIFSDGISLINHFAKEMYGFAFDDDLQERNYVIKYIMKSFPVTAQLSSYMPLYAPELAKDLGIQMSTQARLK